MPRGKRLTDEQRREIYEAYTLGENRRDIAEAYGITATHVSKLVREQRKLDEEASMAHRECIVAGDKKNGRLTSTSDPHRYVGTCVIAGKANSKAFTAANAAAATELWREWCSELRDRGQKPVTAPVETKQQEPVEVKPVEKQEVKSMGNSVYIIWTKGDEPRLFGAYSDMETALKEVDHLNEVASFLVSDRVFEVEELALKA